MCCCLSGCTAFLIGAAMDSAMSPRFTFEVDGYPFEADEELLGTFRVIETGDYGFAIAFSGSEWSVVPEVDKAVIGLNCGFFTGKLKEDKEYVFTTDDALDTYPIFKYSLLSDTFWYNATDGWFRVTRINKKKGTISGTFEFSAVCDDPSNADVIEITSGVFRNIPYISVID